MTQQTTLEMIVKAVDQATGTLDQVKKQLGGLGVQNEQLATSTRSANTESDALAKGLHVLSRAAAGTSGTVGDMVRTVTRATYAFGAGGWLGVIGAATAGVVLLARRVKEAYDRHKELSDLADRLDLPIDKVKEYSKAWLDVAMHLKDVKQGFAELSAAQSAAFQAIGVDPTAKGAQDRTLSLIAGGIGTRQEKLDVLRVLTGVSEADAAKSLDAEMKRLAQRVWAPGYAFNKVNESETRAQAEGVAGTVNVTSLLSSGAVQPDARFQQMKDLGASIDDMFKQLGEDEKKRIADAQKLDDDLLSHKLANLRDYMTSLDDFYSAQRYLLNDTKEQQKQQADDLQQSIDDQLGKLANNAEATAIKIKLPFQDFTESVKKSLDDVAATGDISGKRIVAQLVYQLSRKEIFNAIDKIGEALQNALTAGSGGGGIGGFFAGLFGGNAGGGTASGMRWVGETGPELAASGPNSMRIYNMRQLAFAGAGGVGQSSQAYVDNRQYHVSGIETQAVLSYFERARREDARANIKMLERNGLGSMR